MRRLILILFLLLIPVGAWAAEATLGDCAACSGSCADAGMQQASPNNNYGASATNIIGWGASSSGEARPILQYPISTDDIPAGSTINTVALNLYVVTANNSGVNIICFGLVDANSAYVEGAGDNATADDPTDECSWGYLAYNETVWTGGAGIGAGGFDATAYGNVSGGTTGAKQISFNATGIAYVESKIGSSVAFRLATDTAFSAFKNSVLGMSENATDGYKPTLVINYTPPTVAAPQIIHWGNW